jgi:hypothetical protein
MCGPHYGGKKDAYIAENMASPVLGYAYQNVGKAKTTKEIAR